MKDITRRALEHDAPPETRELIRELVRELEDERRVIMRINQITLANLPSSVETELA